MDFIVALIVLAVGLVALFFGYRLFTAILPILGFVAGAAAGAQAVFLIFGDGFLATVTSIVVAIIVGIVFAALAYFVWALGVVLAVAGMGFAVGTAILPAIGLDLDVVSWVIGVALAAALAIIAVVMRLPKIDRHRAHGALGRRRVNRRRSGLPRPGRAGRARVWRGRCRGEPVVRVDRRSTRAHGHRSCVPGVLDAGLPAGMGRRAVFV